MTEADAAPAGSAAAGSAGTGPRPGWWRGLALGAGAYACVLGFVLFEPSNRVPSSSIYFLSRHLTALGLPAQLSAFLWVDFWCNIAIMVPLAAALVVLWPRVPWERWTVGAFALSASVETTQAIFFPHRVPAFSDVVANTLGVLIGSLLGWVTARSLRLR